MIQLALSDRARRFLDASCPKEVLLGSRLNELALFLGGMLVSGLTNTTIKAMVHRPRPLAYFAKHPAMINGVPHDAACVHVVGKAWKTRSFPSGHAETAFSAATIASILFGGWYWLSYLIALLVAYSRVYSGVHFPLDTLGGAVLGVIVTGAFMLWYRRGG